VKVNPFFNRANLQNDIAVLTLEQPVNLASTPHINPVCPSNFQANYVGRRYVTDIFEAMKPLFLKLVLNWDFHNLLLLNRCWVTGWGKDAFGPPGKIQILIKDLQFKV
jgi:hypothetical protein